MARRSRGHRFVTLRRARTGGDIELNNTGHHPNSYIEVDDEAGPVIIVAVA
jgi:hypothetical protein